MFKVRLIYNFFKKISFEYLKTIAFIMGLAYAYSQYRERKKEIFAPNPDIFNIADYLLEGAVFAAISFICIFTLKYLITQILSVVIKTKINNSIPRNKLKLEAKKSVVEPPSLSEIPKIKEIMIESDKQYEKLILQESNIKKIIIEGIKDIDTRSSSYCSIVKSECLRQINDNLTIEQLYNILCTLIRISKIDISSDTIDENCIYARKKFDKLMLDLSEQNVALNYQFYNSQIDILLNQVNYGVGIINEFIKELIIKQKGHIGEQRVESDLNLYDDYIKYLSNIRFEVEGISVETDGIIVCDKGVFALEIKNYGKKGDTIHVSKDGKVTIKNKNGSSRNVDVIQQHNRHCALKQKVINKELKSLNLIDDYIIMQPMIVIANDDIAIENESDIKFVRASSVIHEILNIKENSISKDIQQEIINIIDNNKLPLKQYPIIDVEETMRSIVYNITVGSTYLCALRGVNENIQNIINEVSVLSIGNIEVSMSSMNLTLANSATPLVTILDLKR